MEKLSLFSEEELRAYLKIHSVINEEFEVDVKQAENIFITPVTCIYGEAEEE